MTESRLGDDVLNACRDIVKSRQVPATRLRSGAASGDLSDLLLWNVGIASILHVVSGLLTHLIYDKANRTKAAGSLGHSLEVLTESNREFMKDPMGNRAADATEVAKGQLPVLENHLSHMRLSSPSEISRVIERATPGVRKLLTEIGPTVDNPDVVARALTTRVAEEVMQRLAGGGDSGEPPGPRVVA